MILAYEKTVYLCGLVVLVEIDFLIQAKYLQLGIVGVMILAYEKTVYLCGLVVYPGNRFPCTGEIPAIRDRRCNDFGV